MVDDQSEWDGLSRVMSDDAGDCIVGNDIITICDGNNPWHHSISTSEGLIQILETLAIPPNSDGDDDDGIRPFQSLVFGLRCFQVLLNVMTI